MSEVINEKIIRCSGLISKESLHSEHEVNSKLIGQAKDFSSFKYKLPSLVELTQGNTDKQIDEVKFEFYYLYLTNLVLLINGIQASLDQDDLLKFKLFIKGDTIMFNIGASYTFKDEPDYDLNPDNNLRLSFSEGPAEPVIEQFLMALYMAYPCDEFVVAFYQVFESRKNGTMPFLTLPITVTESMEGEYDIQDETTVQFYVNRMFTDVDNYDHLVLMYKTLLKNPEIAAKMSSSDYLLQPVLGVYAKELVDYPDTEKRIEANNWIPTEDPAAIFKNLNIDHAEN